MALAFRNLDIRPDAPVETWPTEAVRTALERGDLDVWHRMASAIDLDPWGRTARRIEEVLRADRPYGIAEAMEAVIARARGRAERRERELVAGEIRSALERSGMTAAAFAERIGTSPSRLSTYLSGRVTPSATLLVRIRGEAPEAPR